jgi:hypothetical protein
VTVNPVTFPRLPVTSIRIHTFDEDLFSQALSTMRLEMIFRFSKEFSATGTGTCTV